MYLLLSDPYLTVRSVEWLYAVVGEHLRKKLVYMPLPWFSLRALPKILNEVDVKSVYELVKEEKLKAKQSQDEQEVEKEMENYDWTTLYAEAVSRTRATVLYADEESIGRILPVLLAHHSFVMVVKR